MQQAKVSKWMRRWKVEQMNELDVNLSNLVSISTQQLNVPNKYLHNYLQTSMNKVACSIYANTLRQFYHWCLLFITVTYPGVLDNSYIVATRMSDHCSLVWLELYFIWLYSSLIAFAHNREAHLYLSLRLWDLVCFRMQFHFCTFYTCPVNSWIVSIYSALFSLQIP